MAIQTKLIGPILLVFASSCMSVDDQQTKIEPFLAIGVGQHEVGISGETPPANSKGTGSHAKLATFIGKADRPLRFRVDIEGAFADLSRQEGKFSKIQGLNIFGGICSRHSLFACVEAVGYTNERVLQHSRWVRHDFGSMLSGYVTHLQFILGYKWGRNLVEISKGQIAMNEKDGKQYVHGLTTISYGRLIEPD